MTSWLSWLDTSREDQQRMRELLKLFSDTESRDELGVGQVRDAFSDLLFPGTSVLQNRARYLLIVPCCYQEAQKRGLRGDRLAARVDRNERKVIAALLRGEDTEGMIGRRAGVGVRTLPSNIYAVAAQADHRQIDSGSASATGSSHAHHHPTQDEGRDRAVAPAECQASRSLARNVLRFGRLTTSADQETDNRPLGP
ncbi:DUF6361 family protein [Micromonospora sp. WMMD708]|uniref:DUF6361 family protein n=1 Tax=Micromonospora sp. WMMD708 TaxID=3403464 RepID=UPI003BF4CA4D